MKGLVQSQLGGKHVEELFAALVRDYRQPLYRFVLRNIGSPADAEDIAQQAFVEAYRVLPTFRGDSEVSTWLYGIAMNLVRNYLNRAPHRVRTYEGAEALESLPADVEGPQALVERFEVLERLYGEIALLSPDLRQTFLLVAIEGHSYEDTAAMLEVPIGTVRSRLFRARETLKEKLPDLQRSLQT